MKNWNHILDILMKTWREDCPSENKWHFSKNSARCDFDWVYKEFYFYTVGKNKK